MGGIVQTRHFSTACGDSRLACMNGKPGPDRHDAAGWQAAWRRGAKPRKDIRRTSGKTQKQRWKNRFSVGRQLLRRLMEPVAPEKMIPPAAIRTPARSRAVFHDRPIRERRHTPRERSP
jgi:hypothetical protein